MPTANLASWGSDTLTANGVDSRNNSYLVDGAWDNDDYLGQNNGAQARVPLDAAQEFQVLTGQFDAEFGRTSGAIVNAVIKSGTNKIHGSAFEFFYNKDLRALDFFQAQNHLPKADTQKHEFGGSIGGPIKKDKVHFFADLERVRLNEGRTIQIPARPDLNYSTSRGRRRSESDSDSEGSGAPGSRGRAPWPATLKKRGPPEGGRPVLFHVARAFGADPRFLLVRGVRL